MTNVASTQLARGMRDLPPEEMARVRQVEDAFAATCRSWGYREIRTPVIEHLHLFTSAGTLSPQTLDRVYSFLDWDGWSGERVVLRPDSTIPAARLYSERLDSERVAKLFYRQSVFRFTDGDAPREEWQCGVELIGDTGRVGDLELVTLALDALAAIGVDDVTIRLSHAGVVRAVLAAAGLSLDEQSAAYDRLLDGDLAVVDEVEAKLPQLNAPLRLLFDIEGDGSAYIANVRETLAPAIPDLAAALGELAFAAFGLEALGRRAVISSVLARSFEYYSGMVMAFESGGRRVGSGGRYDDLIETVGGGRVPASGFALHVGPLTELIRDAGEEAGESIAVRPAGESVSLLAEALAAAAILRSAGYVVETLSGADSSAPYSLVCSDRSPRFTLEGFGEPRYGDDIESIVRAMGRSS
jgi:histidyl-tRNA synthetase